MTKQELTQLEGQLVESGDNEQIARLLIQISEHRLLTAQEKIFLLQTAKLDIPIDNPPSMRREDWYGEDGR